MKGNKILGFIWIVLAVILTIILIWKLSSTNGKNNFKLSINGKEHIVSGALSPLCETLTFSTNDFNALDVNLASESITVEKAEGNKVIVEFYCPEDVKPTAEIISNTLKIQSSCYKWFI